jgi:hypothetical protein
VGCLSLLIFTLAFFARNINYGSDPKLTLVVTQSILENGTIYLNAYQDDILIDQPFSTYVDNLVLLPYNGRYYHYFPLGPSVLSLPFVWVANLRGWDMLTTDNYALQRLLAAASSVLLFWLSFALARCYVSPWPSLLLGATAVLGSSLLSTIGIGLWSINFGTLFIALALLLLAQYDSGRLPDPAPLLLGVLLFLTFFVRASAVAFIVAVLLYLLWRDWRHFGKTAVVAATCLFLFLLWSRWEFGQWIPAYYALGRLQVERIAVWVGVLGNLVSPSRGIFVFSPFLVLGFVGLLGYRAFRRPHRLVWAIVLWFALHLLITARAASWWGGWSFGPRLLTETVPGLFLLLVISWHEWQPRLSRPQGWFWQASFALLAAVAIVIHSYQGLYNPYTSLWNGVVVPKPLLPDAGLGDLFRWRYAQPLATADQLCAIEAERVARLLPYAAPLLTVYRWGTPLLPTADTVFRLDERIDQKLRVEKRPFSSPSSRLLPRAFLPLIATPQNGALFVGWANSSELLRWSVCREAALIFQVGEVPAAETVTLAVATAGLGEQPVSLLLNGNFVGEWLVAPLEQGEKTAVFSLPTHFLQPNSLNTLTFHIPDAALPRTVYPDNPDPRLLGIVFAQLTITP